MGVGEKAFPLCSRLLNTDMVLLREENSEKQSVLSPNVGIFLFWVYGVNVFWRLIQTKRTRKSMRRTTTGWQEFSVTSSVSSSDWSKSRSFQVQSCKVHSKKKKSLERHHSPSWQVHFHNHPLNPSLAGFRSNVLLSIPWIKVSPAVLMSAGFKLSILPRGWQVSSAGARAPTPCPRPRVAGSAGRTGRSCGRTADPTPLIRRGTSGGRTAAAAGWADWPADAPLPSPRLSVSCDHHKQQARAVMDEPSLADD